MDKTFTVKFGGVEILDSDGVTYFVCPPCEYPDCSPGIRQGFEQIGIDVLQRLCNAGEAQLSDAEKAKMTRFVAAFRK